MLLELMLIVYLLVGGAAFLESRCKGTAIFLYYQISPCRVMLNEFSTSDASG